MPAPIDDADARRIVRRDFEAGVLERLHRRREAVVHEGIHLPQLLRRQVRLGVEVRDRAAEAHRERTDVEARDRADAAVAREHVVPRRVDRAADGRNDAEAGDDDAPLGQAVTLRMVRVGELRDSESRRRPVALGARSAPAAIRPDCGAR